MVVRRDGGDGGVGIGDRENEGAERVEVFTLFAVECRWRGWSEGRGAS